MLAPTASAPTPARRRRRSPPTVGRSRTAPKAPWRHLNQPISGPARSFPCGAVGRDVADVAAEAPLADPVQGVDPLVGALEAADPTEIRVHHHRRDIVGVHTFEVPLDPHVLEALRAVPGLERLTRPACGYDRVRLEGRGHAGVAEIRGVDVVLGHVAGGIEPLAVGQGDRGTGRAEPCQAYPPADVLSSNTMSAENGPTATSEPTRSRSMPRASLSIPKFAASHGVKGHLQHPSPLLEQAGAGGGHRPAGALDGHLDVHRSRAGDGAARAARCPAEGPTRVYAPRVGPAQGDHISLVCS